jgi:hypothetical protein
VFFIRFRQSGQQHPLPRQVFENLGNRNAKMKNLRRAGYQAFFRNITGVGSERLDPIRFSNIAQTQKHARRI